jgi:hypothetical protein
VEHADSDAEAMECINGSWLFRPKRPILSEVTIGGANQAKRDSIEVGL